MKLVSKMSGGLVETIFLSSSPSWPVYLAKVIGLAGETCLRNFSSSSIWLLAKAFIGYTMIARVLLVLSSCLALSIESMIGTKKHKDLPDPVPVVTT